MIRDFVDNTYDDYGRLYNFNQSVSYYSATTALSNTADKEFLVRWRERLGDEEADRQLAIAQKLGESFHEIGEYWLKNEPMSHKPIALAKMVFKKLKPLLEPITKVHSVEDVLYSDLIRLAGRGDAVVDWKGELAILDFKFVNYWKAEWIYDYWLQCTIYAHMWEFMYGARPKKIILAMGNKKTLQAKVLVKEPGPFAKETIDRIKQFHEMVKI